MFNSIKAKLVILFLAVFSIFFVAVEVFLYYELDGVAIKLADEHLKSEVGFLANLLSIEEKHGQIEKELQEISASAAEVYAEKLSGHYFQIVDSEGRILARSPSLLLADVALPTVDGRETAEFSTIVGPAGENARMMVQTFLFDAGPMTFIAADDLQDTYNLISFFRRVVLFIFPAVFVFSAIGVFVLSGWSLRPVKAFTSQVGGIGEENLGERVDEKGLPVELQPLAASFNLMLSRLEASFTKQRQFLSDASHELRTPTTIIKSFCEVTLGKEREADDYKVAIKKIGDTVNRMCDIINRILVISRLDAKTIHFKPVRVDLYDVMGDVTRLIEPSSSGKGVKIKLTGASTTIRGDREGITEVFTNVVENAVKYNRPDGTVEVRVCQDHERAVVTVADTGIGIPPSEIDRIFDRFYRVDASRGVTVGSGLGLSIVKSIVEEHGGEISVDSVPGKGTTFTITLPMNYDFGEKGNR